MESNGTTELTNRAAYDRDQVLLAELGSTPLTSPRYDAIQAERRSLFLRVRNYLSEQDARQDRS